MPAGTIRIEGLKELRKASKAAGKATDKLVREALKQAGEPVRVRAELLAQMDVQAGAKWSRMKTGTTTRTVYIAPAAKRAGGSPRPNFGGLLMRKAMAPALEQRQDQAVREIEEALDKIADVFERGA
jgi:hypothetical protein